MNSVEQAIQKNLMEDLKEKTDFIFDSLVTNKVNSKLPEEIFKQNFLPYFSGQLPITKDSNVLSNWIGVAGTPTSEVDVINQAGITLYTVPSLFDTNIIALTGGNKSTSFRDIFTEFELRNNNIPSAANSYLRKALDNKLENIKQDSPKSETTEQRWDAILNRYDIKNKSGDIQKKQADVNVEDDLIYD